MPFYPSRFRRNALITLLLLFALLQTTSGQAPASNAGQVDSTRHILLVFSGSDWCLPCIKLEKQILSDSSFLDFAATHLQVIKVDFHKRKKLSGEQMKENETWAEHYNPEGTFPKRLLLNPDRSVRAILSWTNENTASFIGQVEQLLNTN